MYLEISAIDEIFISSIISLSIIVTGERSISVDSRYDPITVTSSIVSAFKNMS